MYPFDVSSTGRRLIEFYRRLPPSVTPILLIILVVLVGNAAYLLGVTNNDPISWTADISHSLCRLTCGRSSIDPNVGALTQALGHRAALDLVHGHLPWWNPYEGLGSPLAGELQSAALFPFTVLLAVPAGLVWMHVILEAIAGITTYLFLRRLSIPVAFAMVGGMLFALDGTFAWLANTVVNPLAFLPMLLLGVEIILDRSSDSTRRGLSVAALALALSLYSGFPEGAYFDAIFCGVWALIRLFSLPRDVRLRALRRLGAAAGLGVALALPTLVPFADFLKVAYVGGHTSAIDGFATMPSKAIPMLFSPYVYGTIFSNLKLARAWGSVGGYFTVSLAALAIVGLFGSRLRAIRIFLALWFAIGMAGALNFLHARDLWNLFPFVDTSAFSRYIISSCELALIVLAVLGLSDIAARRSARFYLIGSSIIMALTLIWCTVAAESYNRGVPHQAKVKIFLLLLMLVPFVVIGAIFLLSLLKRQWWSTYAIAALLVAESGLMFIVPTLQAPKKITVDYSPIHYLVAHQGEGRFLDAGVLLPNWGSEFGLHELSAIDLPFPTNFKNFIQNNLYTELTPPNEFLVSEGMSGVVNLEHQVIDHFDSYENASVKYLLVPSSVVLLPQLTQLGVKQVFRDSLATIYSLPSPRSFFSSSSCTVASTGVNEAVATCTGSNAHVLRTELAMKGWTATVNGHPEKIHTIDGVYQQVNVPSGTSTIRYNFTPPHEDPAILVGIVAAILLVLSQVFDIRRRPLLRRRRDQSVSPSASGQG